MIKWILIVWVAVGLVTMAFHFEAGLQVLVGPLVVALMVGMFLLPFYILRGLVRMVVGRPKGGWKSDGR